MTEGTEERNIDFQQSVEAYFAHYNLNELKIKSGIDITILSKIRNGVQRRLTPLSIVTLINVFNEDKFLISLKEANDLLQSAGIPGFDILLKTPLKFYKTKEENDQFINDMATPLRKRLKPDSSHHREPGSETFSETEKQALRRAYLSYVLDQFHLFKLKGITRPMGDETEARINLSAIYTALITSEAEDEPEYKQHNTKRQPIYLSVVDQANKHNRLVLLGDPGSGKTTFAHYIAMCMAGEELGHEYLNIKNLVRPLKYNETPEHKKPQIQHWDHGALTPIFVTLRDFSSYKLFPNSELPSRNYVWNFVENNLHEKGLSAFAPLLRSELLVKGGIILFDGLDEVPEAEARREQIIQMIEHFSEAFPLCRFLVTSRTYAYQKQEWKLTGFFESTIMPFNELQIKQFIDCWYDHIWVLQGKKAQEGQSKSEDLKRAILNNQNLMALAERPLLLTLIASIHTWRGGILPDKRQELYADAVELLLDWWESSQHAVYNKQGEIVIGQPSLIEWLKVDRKKVRDLLNELAYKIHTEQNELDSVANIAEDDLITGLMAISQNPDIRPRRLIEHLRDRAGLLIPRGVKVYSFPHRTFQEYLAACYLTEYEYPDLIASLTRADVNRWREIALLAGSKAATGSNFALWALVDALSPEDEEESGEERYWGAHIAGQLARESSNLDKISNSIQPKIKRIRQRLVEIMEQGHLPAIERVQAGENLSKIGDIRFDESLWNLPNDEMFGFVLIPEGNFTMGNKTNDSYEHPEHEPYLKDFWIAKYPVTVSQFRSFVNSKKHPFDKWEGNLIPAHPVVDVTWYDALEYSKWLQEELYKYAQAQIKVNPRHKLWKGISNKKLYVTLPGEAEWEKAARHVTGYVWNSDTGIFPWGEEFRPNMANVKETQIGTKSVVGCFPPNGNGLFDMNGNVLEWTRSLWGTNWEKPVYKYPYYLDEVARENLRADESFFRVLRGGSFSQAANHASCFYRNRELPTIKSRNIGFRVALSSSILN